MKPKKGREEGKERRLSELKGSGKKRRGQAWGSGVRIERIGK